MLTIKKLSINYPNKKVIKNITFSLNKGEKIVIVGASGCGKTTLLKAIAGLISTSKGEIRLNKEIVKGPDNKLVPGHESIKLVNQDFELDEFHSVEENIRLRLLQFNKRYIQTRIKELLNITQLEKFKKLQAKNLSGGQKQRLALARALADEPEILLLDEPFNQLDFNIRLSIENYLKIYFLENQTSVIMVSHNGEEAMRWGDKIIYIEDGKIKRIDTPINFYNHPQTIEEAGFFGVINTIPENNYFFRPNDFSKEKNDDYTFPVSIKFKEKINKGWYSEFFFQTKNENLIVLYSQDEISDLTKIFIKASQFEV